MNTQYFTDEYGRIVRVEVDVNGFIHIPEEHEEDDDYADQD